MARYTQAEYQAAREVNLIEFLEAAGYELERSGHDYQLKIHDSLKINPDGQKWYWHSRSVGGKSPIELLKELEGLDTINAIKKLAAFSLGNEVSISGEVKKRVESLAVKEKKAFKLPERNLTNKRAFAYLAQTRKIDTDIISWAMAEGLIYESKQYHNAVFLGQKDDSGEIKYASLRGTYTNAEKPFKGDVDGSDKRYSFVMEGTSDKLYILESAIDALSHATLAKLSGDDWQRDHRLSLGGMSDGALELYLSRHPEIKQLEFCLDNDIDGKNKNGEPENHGQVRAAKLGEIYKEKGYIVNNAPPTAKDVNEDLRIRITNPSEIDPVKTKSKEKPEDIFKRLEAGILSVYSSDEYLKYLKVMAKFHRYSVANSILILMQFPQATKVAGYEAWKRDFERSVRKGEKGIRILAPADHITKVPVKEIDPVSGEIVETEKQVKQKYFRPVSVFDISQTDGKELPALLEELKGEAGNYISLMAAVIKVAKIPVEFEEIKNGSKGYYSWKDDRIAIKSGMSELQTIKTAIHELVHARLHGIEAIASDAARHIKEIQAESVAFVVSEHFGLDTSDYSFPYVANWSEGKELKELKESLELIKKESNALICELDEQMAVEKEKALVGTNEKTAEIKLDSALYAHENGVAIYNAEGEKLLNESEIRVALNRKILVSDIDLQKDRIPKIYEQYLFKLFKEGFKKDPVKTLDIFGEVIPKSDLNEIVLLKDPLIQKTLSSGTNIKDCVSVIQEQIKKANAVSGKVKVQINWSEANIPSGQFLSFGAANNLFAQEEAKVREEQKNTEYKFYNKTQFGLYVEHNGSWIYGVSRYDIGDGFATDLMDFINKTIDPDVAMRCEKELQKNEKKTEEKSGTVKKNEIEREDK
ncbi:MAG: DUF3991 domain-containing protein [Eubacteriales bacterium]|nr:DUF3991 domain-containing protein [Eubacteriales bacterium]